MFSSCNGTFQMKESSKEPSNNNLMLEYNDDIPVPVLDPRPHSLYPSSWSLTCGPASALCPCRITFASTQQLLPGKKKLVSISSRRLDHIIPHDAPNNFDVY